MLINDMIERGAKRFADRPALLFGDVTLTFAQVNDLANRLANALGGLGVMPGRRVGLLINNGPYSVSMDFACTKAGAIRVPLNARLSAAEHTRMLAAMDVDLLIFGPDLVDRARELEAALPGLRLLGLGTDTDDQDLLRLAAMESGQPPTHRPEPDDVVLALYTSGTTGVLKAAEHTQASLAAVVLNILNNLVDPVEGDVMLHAASMIHASGTFVLPFWVRGGASAILPGFTPTSYLRAIQTWRPSVLNLVPTMIGMLLDHPGVQPARFDSVKTLIYGASPMPAPLMDRALDFFGLRLVQYYGQTEAPLAIASLSKSDHGPEFAHRRLACGFPAVDCELRVLGADGEPALAGEPGEIVVRAPFLMKGYYGAPELNAEHTLPGGWLKTRDIGRLDEDGCLYLVDRLSEMIVSGGYNIYPKEVEDALTAHPEVREAAVVGLPDDKWGEAVTGFVVLRHPGAALEQDLIAFVRERLAAYKTPKEIRFIDEIPKSPVGKPMRRLLREPFWAGRERAI
ncbi:AMP-binding protein [uncultured Brevundimonas sp.]|uniref:class I adenylate-forming enzyme family protein n=1 Tax=uncultured Brevundimonas sp. TaxID=213418 RepID=UPI0030EC24E9|tara:strand:+ start:3537 stop:5075 length:1539 start_codon:yes stop_codon:yes gene_type:complete